MTKPEPVRETPKVRSPIRDGASFVSDRRDPLANSGRARAGFAIFVAVLAAIFIHPLFSLVTYAAQSDLNSSILLIPFVSAYLIYTKRRELPNEYRLSPGWAVIFFAVGATALTIALGLYPWWSFSQNDHLALMTFSFLGFLTGGGFLFLGWRIMSAVAFPFAFLLFMVPLPDRAVDWLETASKLASADVASLLFDFSGTPVLRDGTVFQLPGIVIEVAQECSGLHSSWVLFITSVLAAHLFLKAASRRWLFVALVVPLGLLRNGFRILVIGLLCVEIGPQMIDSAIHKHGGPLFFALSLVPLFLILWWLRRAEAKVALRETPAAAVGKIGPDLGAEVLKSDS